MFANEKLNMITTIRQTAAAIRDRIFSKSIPTKRGIGSGCQWWVDTKGLSKESIVYSAGVGFDISFERELVHTFGCQVWLYDPSPTALRTVSSLPEREKNIFFFAIGLAGSNGVFSFSPPTDPNEGSFSISEDNRETGIKFQCRNLERLLQENGHDYIDLLKMDIEGAEYQVIDHICDVGLKIHQICVEFHDFCDTIPKSRTRQGIRRLREAGYELIHKNRHDHTFIHVAHLE